MVHSVCFRLDLLVFRALYVSIRVNLGVLVIFALW